MTDIDITLPERCQNCTVPRTACEKSLPQICGVCQTQKLLSGKWKFLLLWLLNDGTKRFSEIYKLVPGITQTVLTKQLRELEADGFISRYVYQEVPPKVEYSLTEKGESFIPILEKMADWGMKSFGT
ncbi:MAG: winged helix-turn-helix transcriptional regulator [Methanocorpusculum sp.]|nr:winged helix-turn-helix transcriptional regulator [Methanocorpusculum sp.]